MKRVCFYLALLLVLSLAIPAYADNPETGNGAPSGAHYNLNIIGVPKDKSNDMTENSGHRIFVRLVGKTKIMLSEGEYKVLDADGTDGSAAFQLPRPDPDGDGVTVYSVWVRALGKPGGSAMMGACAQDSEETEYYCENYTMIMRMKGNGKFSNVSADLLYVYTDLDGDGTAERYPLFDKALYEYFWNYDNNGLKLAQLRFYEVPTNVN